MFNRVFLSELYTAWVERLTFAGELQEGTDFTTGCDIQNNSGDPPAFSGYQHQVAYHLLPHFIPIKADYSGPVPVPYVANDSQFFVDAGITPVGGPSYGFRRATAWNPSSDDWTDIADPMFSYGFIQAGDILGPWIIVDLQNALSILKHKLRITAYSFTAPRLRITAPAGSSATCAAMLADGSARWTAASWTDGSSYPTTPKYPYGCFSRITCLSSSYYYATSNRSYYIYTRESDVALLAAGRPVVADYYAIQPASAPLAPDFPAVAAGECVLIKSNMAAGDTVSMQFDEDPITALGRTCPIAIPSTNTIDIRMTDTWIIKHDPTNSNV
jgi:hypothetical protein